MRPRVRSYGESSTATLSPGRMRMKFLRIFPETCASTRCLFSSSTRNMALGSGSTTTAITSIASSLLIDSLKTALSLWLLAFSEKPRTVLLRQNHRTLSRHRHTVLEMSAATAVRGNRCPFIAQHSRLGLAVIHHGLNRDHHSLAQFGAVPPSPEVRHLRLFVQPRPDPVANELADHAESRGFHVLLHRRTHVANRVPDPRLLYPAVQRRFRHFQ